MVDAWSWKPEWWEAAVWAAALQWFLPNGSHSQTTPLHFGGGIISLSLLYPLLARFNATDVGLRFQLQTTRPSLGQMVADGELVIGLTFNPNEAANLIVTQQLPATAYSFGFTGGTIGAVCTITTGISCARTIFAIATAPAGTPAAKAPPPGAPAVAAVAFEEAATWCLPWPC